VVEDLGKRLWLGCDLCRHSVMIAPRQFAASLPIGMASTSKCRC
jgi:hypothetical protein